MKEIMPWRSRVKSPDLPPLEQWLTNVFEDNGLLPGLPGETHIPRADIQETEGEYLISVELPGMDEKEITVELSGNQLVVSGERKQRKDKKTGRMHRTECTYGAFERTFELPKWARLDSDSFSAEFKQGILEIRVPKMERQPIAKIPIKSV
jgi:HSP20 family protein